MKNICSYGFLGFFKQILQYFSLILNLKKIQGVQFECTIYLVDREVDVLVGIYCMTVSFEVFAK